MGVPSKVRELFAALDKDNSGSVEASELDVILQNLGVSDAELRQQMLPELLAKIDQDGDGIITLEEFSKAAVEMNLFGDLSEEGEEGSASEPPQLDARKEFRALELFDQIDGDGSGSIDQGELENVLASMGMSDKYQRKATAAELMRHLDKDGGGSVTRDEFLHSVREGVFDNWLAGDDRSSEGRNSAPISRTGTPGVILPPGERPFPEASVATQNIPEEKRRFLWNIFNIADDDGGGTIGLDELFGLLSDKTLLGKGFADIDTSIITRSYVEKVMKELDTTGDGKLDFDEFCVAFDQMFSSGGSAAEGNTVMHAQTRAFMKENAEIQKQLELIRSHNEMLRTEMEKQATELRNQLHDAQELNQDELERSATRIETLEGQNHDLRRHLQDARTTIEKLEGQIEEHQEEIQTLRRQSRASMGILDADNEGDTNSRSSRDIELLRQRFEQKENHYQHQLRLYIEQVEIAEKQLSDSGLHLNRIPGLEAEIKYLEDSNSELRTELDTLRDKLEGGFESLAKELAPVPEVQVRDDNDALRQLKDALEKIARMEYFLNSYKSESSAILERCNAQLKSSDDRARRSEEELVTFKEQTERFFNEQRESWDVERERLQAQVYELRSVKDQWEEHLKSCQGPSLSDRLARARELSKPSSQLAEEMLALRQQIEESQNQKLAADEQLEAFKLKTAEMWQLHQENVTAQIDEARAASEAETTAFKQRIAALQEEMRRKNDEYERKICELEDGLKGHERTKGSTAEEHQKEMDALRDRVSRELQTEFERRMTELRTEHEREIKTLQRDLESAKSEHNEAQRKLQERIEHLLAEAAAKESQLAKTRASHDQTGKEKAERDDLIERLNVDLRLAQSQLREHKERNEAMKSDLNHLQAEIEAKSIEREQLMGFLNDVNARVKQLEAELTGAHSDRDARATDFRGKLLEKQSEYESLIVTLKNTIAQLQAQLDESVKEKEKALRSGSKSTADLEGRIRSLEATAQSQREEHEKSLSRLREQVSALQVSLEQATDEKTRLEAEHAHQLRSKESSALDKLTERSMAAEDAASAVVRLKADLERAHEDRKRAVDEFLAKLAEKQAALLAAQNERETLITEHKTKLAEASAEALRARSVFEKEISALQDEIRDLHAKADMALKQSTVEREELVKRIRELEAELGKKQAELDRFNSEVGAKIQEREALFEVERGEFRMKLNTLQTDLKNTQTELERVRGEHNKTIEELQEALRLKQQELDSVRIEKDRLILEWRTKHSESVTVVEHLKEQQERQKERGMKPLTREINVGSADSDKTIRDLRIRVSELEASISSHGPAIDRITREMDARLREQAALFEAERGEYDLKIRDGKARLEELQTELDRLRAEREEVVDDFRKRLAEKHARLEQVQAERDRLASELREKIAQLESENDRLGRDHARALDSAQGEHRIQRERALQSHSETERTTVELRTRLKDLEAQAAMHQSDLDRLENEYRTKLKEQEALMEAAKIAALEDLQKRIRQLEADLQKAAQDREAAVADFLGKLKAKQAQIESAQAEKERAVTELRLRIASLEDELASLRRQLDKANSALSEKDRSHDDSVTSMRTEFERKLTSAQNTRERALPPGASKEEVDRLTSEWTGRLKEQQALFDAERSELKLRYQELAGRLDGLQGEHDRLRLEKERAVADLRGDLQERQRLLDSAAAGKEDLLRELNALRLSHREVSSKWDLDRAELDRATRDFARPKGLSDQERLELTNRIAELTSKLHEFETLAEAVQADMERLLAENNARLREREALFEAERGEHQLRIQNYASEVQDLKSELARLRAARASLEDELKDVLRQKQEAISERHRVAQDYELKINDHRSQLERAREDQLALRSERSMRPADDGDSRQVTNLTRANAELRDRVSDLQLEVERSMAQRDQVYALLADREAALQAQQIELERGAADYSARIKNLESTLEVAQREREAVARDFAQRMQDQQKRMDEALKNRDEIAAQLKLKLSDLQSRYEQTEVERSTRSQAHVDHISTLELRTVEIQAEQERTAQLLRMQLKEHEILSEEYRRKYEQALSDKAAAEHALERARDEARMDRQQAFEAAEARVKQLEAALERAKRDREAVAADFADRLGEKQRRFDDMLAERQRAIENLKLDIEELRRLLDGAISEKERMREEMSRGFSQQRERSLPSSSGMSAADVAALKEAMRDLERLLNEQRVRADQLQGKLMEKEALLVAEDLDRQAALRDLTSRIRELEDEVKRVIGERELVAKQFREKLVEQQSRVKQALEDRQRFLSQLQELQSENLNLQGLLSQAKRERMSSEAEQQTRGERGSPTKMLDDERAIRSLQTRIFELQTAVELARAEADDAHAQLRERDTVKDAGEWSNANALADANARLLHLEAELDRARTDRDDVAKAFREKLRDLQRKLDDALGECGRLQAEIGALKQRISELELQIARLQMDKERLALQQVETSRSASQQVERGLRPDDASAIQRLEATIRQYQLDLSSAQSERGLLESKLQQREVLLQAAGRGEEGALRAANERIHQLEDELTKSVRSRESITREFRTRLDDQTQSLGDGNREREQLISDLRTQLHEKDAQLERVLLDHSRVARDMGSADSAASVASLRTQVRSLQSEVDALSSDRQTLQVRMQEKENLVRILQSSTTRNSQTDETLLRQVQMDLERALADREAAARMFESRLDQQQRHLDEALLERQRLSDELRDLVVNANDNTALRRSREMQASLEAKLAQAQADLARAHAQMEELRITARFTNQQRTHTATSMQSSGNNLRGMDGDCCEMCQGSLVGTKAVKSEGHFYHSACFQKISPTFASTRRGTASASPADRRVVVQQRVHSVTGDDFGGRGTGSSAWYSHRTSQQMY